MFGDLKKFKEMNDLCTSVISFPDNINEINIRVHSDNDMIENYIKEPHICIFSLSS